MFFQCNSLQITHKGILTKRTESNYFFLVLIMRRLVHMFSSFVTFTPKKGVFSFSATVSLFYINLRFIWATTNISGQAMWHLRSTTNTQHESVCTCTSTHQVELVAVVLGPAVACSVLSLYLLQLSSTRVFSHSHCETSQATTLYYEIFSHPGCSLVTWASFFHYSCHQPKSSDLYLTSTIGIIIPLLPIHLTCYCQISCHPTYLL